MTAKNYLFLTQSVSLSLFYDIANLLINDGLLEKAGFYLSDSRYFEIFKKENPQIISESSDWLKEWEIIEKSFLIKPDLERLKIAESRLGDPVLWNAVVADRRIYLGKKRSLQQDYASHYSHQEMLSILQVNCWEAHIMDSPWFLT